jgi:hypothetical protein
MLRVVLLSILLGTVAHAAPPPTTALEKELIAQHGEAQRARIERGVRQVAALWRSEDGDLASFVKAQLIVDPKQLDATFDRLQRALESLDGHLLEIQRDLRSPLDLDTGPLLPADPLLGAYDPYAHLLDDLFAQKIAFVALLNFPATRLAERLAGKGWTRRQWAEARLTGRFGRRVPAAVAQKITEAQSAAELYIAEYNLWMHHVVDDSGARPFPKGMRLITHWNLRDELKAAYADPKGLLKQRLIAKVMDRIVTQTIPAAVIDNPRVDWNPFSNAVTPAQDIEADAPPPRAPQSDREPDTRYAHVLAIHQAHKLADAHSPLYPTAMARTFEQDSEIPESRVVAMMNEILDSPLAPKVAAVIEKRLGRKLEPQDLWYAGFKPQADHDEAALDALTRKRYPTAAAFAADMPRLLTALGFPEARAKFIADHVVVDPSRGAGHAMQASRRGDKPHLRTRVEADGMNYKGYNIAVHELGHNAEQVISLYDVDHTLLQGVPLTAITEAMAFLFQARDLELLGVGKPNAEADRLRTLEVFWTTRQMAGVALVEIRLWHWLYDHPKATPAEVREATLVIARDIWNKRFAPLLGGKDQTLLGIYSHMLSTPLYLFQYGIGQLVAFQVEQHAKRKGAPPLGVDFERMTKVGKIVPDLWMQNAVGAPISTKPLLEATAAAVR